jgi:hypothetical protein
MIPWYWKPPGGGDTTPKTVQELRRMHLLILHEKHVSSCVLCGERPYAYEQAATWLLSDHVLVWLPSTHPDQYHLIVEQDS